MANVILALDSGAHSVYKFKFAPSQQKGRRARDFRTYDFYKSPEFTQYMDDYIEYVHLNRRRLEFYVSLDIIFNAKLSWQTCQYIESNGLIPVPVFHYGEDVKYLHRYMDKYEYIGIGGIGQDISLRRFLDFGDRVFGEICDKHGKPRWKVHGFAMTSVQLMKRYPWYSTDSSTWTSLSRNGWVRFPKLSVNYGDYRWLEKPRGYRFTDRSNHSPAYYRNMPDLYLTHMDKYLQEMFGYRLCNMVDDYFARDVANAGHHLHLTHALKRYYGERFGYEEGANLYLAGKASCGMQTDRQMRRLFVKATKKLPKNFDIRYLGTFFYKKDINLMYRCLKPIERRRLNGI